MTDRDPMRAVAEAAARRDATIAQSQRKQRGVVHTPVALARFMARRVAEVEGTLVDPACGPGVFLAACMQEHEAPRRALGIDIDGGVVERAASILVPLADKRGWSLSFSIGNTLAAPIVEAGPIIVIGNPPWAGRSANRGRGYTDALLDDFKRDADGSDLGERKIGVLSDDYVRFFRWSCEQVRRPEGGAVALVTNASFLDGPVHRGMRACLLRWFSEIEVIDLGGSALIARRGDRDENVFGVRPGATITIARRPVDHDESSEATVSYAALRGAKAEKLGALERYTDGTESPEMQRLRPRAPWWRFVPTPEVGPEYGGWPSLPELMPFHREGMQTNRDAFCVDADREVLERRLELFAQGAEGPWPGKADQKSRHYDPERARAALREAVAGSAPVVRRVAYRPLDDRWACVVRNVSHRPRPALLRALERSDGAVLTVRKDRGERPWSHFGFSRLPPDNCFLSSRSSCRTRAFPTHGPEGEPNVDAPRVETWAGFEPSSVALSRYVLCVLASDTYRALYDTALRADYPRIPPPTTKSVFETCAAAGEQLAAAFSGSALSVPCGGQRSVIVGHRPLTCEKLHVAIEACERAVVEGRLLPKAH